MAEPTDDATPATPDAHRIYLWPCNFDTWRVWQSVQTQWRHAGMDGRRSGLCYASVIAWLREQPGIKRKDRARHMAGIRAMESAALDVWAQQHAQKGA